MTGNRRTCAIWSIWTDAERPARAPDRPLVRSAAQLPRVARAATTRARPLVATAAARRARLLIVARSVALGAALASISACGSERPIAAIEATPIATASPPPRAGEPGPDAATAGEAPPSATARLVVDAERIELGELWRGEALTRVFTLANEGSAPLTIDSIRNGCACTAARLAFGATTLEKEALETTRPLCRLAPGERASLQIELVTAKLPLEGKATPVEKSLLVRSDDPRRPELRLALHGTLVAPWRLEPATLDFGRVRRGATARRSATLRIDAALGSIEVLGAASPLPEALRVSIAPGAAAAVGDDPSRSTPASWQLDVELLPGAPLGTLAADLRVAVRHPRLRELLLPVRATIEPNVDFQLAGRPAPRALDLGTVASGGSGAPLELSIENRREELPYRPTRVAIEHARPDADALRAELVTIAEGKRYVVRITAAPGSAPALLQGELVIEADHPEVAVRRFEVRALRR